MLQECCERVTELCLSSDGRGWTSGTKKALKARGVKGYHSLFQTAFFMLVSMHCKCREDVSENYQLCDLLSKRSAYRMFPEPGTSPELLLPAGGQHRERFHQVTCSAMEGGVRDSKCQELWAWRGEYYSLGSRNLVALCFLKSRTLASFLWWVSVTATANKALFISLQ